MFVYSVSLILYIVTLHSSVCDPFVWGQSYMYCVLGFCVFLICIRYVLLWSVFSHNTLSWTHVATVCSCGGSGAAAVSEALLYKQPLSPFLTLSCNLGCIPARSSTQKFLPFVFILKQTIDLCPFL